MDYIRLNEIKILGNVAKYYFSAPRKFIKFLKTEQEPFFVEYPEGTNLDDCPRGIMMVPFVGCMLSVAMILKLTIEVPEIDGTFLESLPRIREAYKRMFPYSNFIFDVKAQNVVRCYRDCAPPRYMRKSLFFTGGVDATSALVEKFAEKPLLINIWGGDVGTQDLSSHMELEEYFSRISKEMSLQYVFIKSNCREIFNESKVTKMLATKLLPWHNHGWWASVAHIISMSTLVAPLSYEKNIGVNYIASSYDAKDKTFDANNNAMLSAIRFGKCKLKPVDSNLERTKKVKKIIDFSSAYNVPLDLKVCWYRKAGKNCSHCEKCYRTILEIVAEHGNPNDFGFFATADTYKEIKEYLKNNYVNPAYWKPIQDAYIDERDYWTERPDMSWILDVKLNSAKALALKVVATLKKFI